MKTKKIGKRIFAVVMALCIVMMYSGVAFAEEGNDPTVPTCPDHQDSVMELVEDSDTATCTQAGTVTYKCTVEIASEDGAEPTVCGKEITVDSPAKGHVSDEGVITTPATCIGEGVKTYSCTVCGEELGTEAVEATGIHNYGTDGKCTTEGCDASIELSENTVALIGEKQYSSLDEAVKLANDGDTIVLLGNQPLTKIYNKDITFTGNGTISVENYTYNNGFKNTWTFDGSGIKFTWVNGDDNWLMWSLGSGTLRLTNGAKATFSFDSKMTKSCTALYVTNKSKIEVLNGASFEILGKTATNTIGQGIQSDSANGTKITVTNGSKFLIDGTNRGYVCSPNITVIDSTFTVQNCTSNASNGGTFYAENSEVNFLNNTALGLSAGTVISKNSIFNLCNNGNAGLVISDGKSKSSFDKTSKVYVNNNGSNIYGGFLAGSDITFESGSVLEVKNNAATGITVPVGKIQWVSNTIGNLNIEDGVKITVTGNNNDSAYVDRFNSAFDAVGGGMWIQGNAVLPKDAVIYNNHAKTAGDDIYLYDSATLSFGPVGSDWYLDGDPDCEDQITGWFYDGYRVDEAVAQPKAINMLATATPDTTRWNVKGCKDGESYTYEYTPSGTATGILALKAAHADYKVTYKYEGNKPDDASALPEDARYNKGDNVTVAADAKTTSEGWTFDGWKIDGEAAGTNFDMPGKNVTVVGTWTYKTPETPVIPGVPVEPEGVYTVTYWDGIDGNGNVIQSTGDLKKGVDTPTCADPTRDGYEFTGWTPVVEKTVTGNANYVATWKKVEDKPDVDPNGGSDVIDDDDDDDINTDPMGDPDSINDGDDTDASAQGVKTGDSTDMIPWALGFGTAVMLLGGAVVLRRREE